MLLKFRFTLGVTGINLKINYDPQGEAKIKPCYVKLGSTYQLHEQQVL